MSLPHELESEQYWKHVDWVLEAPACRASLYLRSMFEVRVLRLYEEPDIRDEDCICII